MIDELGDPIVTDEELVTDDDDSVLAATSATNHSDLTAVGPVVSLGIYPGAGESKHHAGPLADWLFQEWERHAAGLMSGNYGWYLGIGVALNGHAWMIHHRSKRHVEEALRKAQVSWTAMRVERLLEAESIEVDCGCG